MRAVLICWLMLATATVAAAARQGKPEKPKGCLTGSALEATELGSVDATGGLSSAVTFQLRGDKALLKDMRDKYDGKIVAQTEGQFASWSMQLTEVEWRPLTSKPRIDCDTRADYSA